MMNDLDIGDDTGTAGLAFAFGGDGEAYFVAVIAERRSLVGLLPEGADQLSIPHLRGQLFPTILLSVGVYRPPREYLQRKKVRLLCC